MQWLMYHTDICMFSPIYLNFLSSFYVLFCIFIEIYKSNNLFTTDKTLELLVQSCLYVIKRFDCTQLEVYYAIIAGIIRIRNNHTTDSCN